MRFKHTFHVFVDNFSTTYKLLLYRIIVAVLFTCIYTAIIFPFIVRVTGAEQFLQLSDAIRGVLTAISDLDMDEVSAALPALRQAVTSFSQFMSTKTGELIGGVVIILVVYLVQKFVHGIGNYTVGAMLNDKIALQANSPFIGTLVKNLGKASLYNLIYIPLSFVYDLACIVIVYLLFFKALTFIPVIFQIFLFVTVIVGLTTLKMTYTTDWLPSLVHGKKNNRQAMAYSFSRKGKNTAGVFSNFLVLILIIFAINSAAVLLTFGAGLIITLPSSYLLIIAFEFINYCDTNDLRYFLDKNTVVKPQKEHTPTREEFFKGEQ